MKMVEQELIERMAQVEQLMKVELEVQKLMVVLVLEVVQPIKEVLEAPK